NKAILEKRINIRAADYRFIDKKKYYKPDSGSRKKPTKNQELLKMVKSNRDFTEQDIIARERKIIESFIEYLKINELLI
ncbi:MAG: hypothetical protein II948_04940, partial [Synergistaceae bacterium]|nr:hypothetical protein [Synergistaceae bacterium]